MKGDGNINIKIKFIGIGINDNNQAKVIIYDSIGNIIYEGLTYNGELCINLFKNTTYKICALFYNERIVRYIYTNTCEYIFMFNHSTVSRRTITFLLKDYYYNLPIERGKIILWQR